MGKVTPTECGGRQVGSGGLSIMRAGVGSMANYSRAKKLNLVLAWMSRTLALVRPLNMPFNIMIEPTNVCNLKCPACPTGSNRLPFKKGRMSLADFRTLVDELGPHATYAQLWGFGEPFLHPQILEMVAYCKEFGMGVRISTNGQFLGDTSSAERLVTSGLDSLKISLDGATEETLQKYRVNASLDRILGGIRQINEAKARCASKHPRLVLQFIVMKHNQHEIPRMKELAAELKMKYKQKTVWVEEDTAEDFLPEKGYSRFFIDPKTRALRPTKQRPGLCPFPWDWAMVNWDGTVVPCCKDPYRYHLFGNALEEKYRTIWRSKEFADFRKRLLRDPSRVKKCNRCVFS
jgi:radical SAM protein with 4Fe4S-binding SPASM domain